MSGGWDEDDDEDDDAAAAADGAAGGEDEDEAGGAVRGRRGRRRARGAASDGGDGDGGDDGDDGDDGDGDWAGDGGGHRRRRQRVRAGAPRDLAARIVRGVLEGRGLARAHLARAAGRGLGPQDLGLLTELVYGTVRRAATVDAVLDALARGGVGRVDDDLLGHLRVAAYQLLFLDHVPPAVAVNEAVAAVGPEHLRGFTNGVLRAVGRAVARRVPGDDPPRGVPSTRRCPGRDGGWVVLERDVFPDAARDPAGWLAAAASFPRRTCAAWVERLGPEGALALARAQDGPPPVFLRVNLRRATREALLERLRAAGVEAAPGGPPEALRLGASLPAAARALVDEGLATVQDATAMRVAAAVDPRPGERVVDLCAAPGGKATHLAERMEDRGRVDALDVAPGRLAKVDAAARRLGLTIVRTGPAEGPLPDPEAGPVDRVLVDAPCSNTGVLRRRVEARWRLDRLDLPALDALQARLLERAVDLVRPGGLVVYSTCAIEPRENEERVRALLARRADVTLEGEEATLPTAGGGDGGYFARLRRRG